MLKKIMIPVAAFAVTVTGASAYSSDILSKTNIDLTDTQVSALEQVHELKKDGADRDEIQEMLDAAGLDEDTMKEIHEAVRGVQDENREAVQTAIENDDYTAFQAAIADSPLADSITSEADFETFKVAQELMKSGDKDGAEALFTELGIEKPMGGEGRGEGMGGERGGEGKGGENEAVRTAIENDDYDAFQTAIADSPLADVITSEADFETFKAAQELMKSGDKDGAEALFTELGMEKPEGKGGQGGGMKGGDEDQVKGDGAGKRDGAGPRGMQN